MLESNHEIERLKALYDADLLDTESESAFDSIVDVTRDLFNVPITLVSLVDKDRQWFKSCFGLKEKETSRDVSFCSLAIKENHTFVVLDATKDERFKNNPLVINKPKIRFYAGHQITSSDGYNLGTLCIIDNKPRKDFSDTERKNLENLANIISSLIQNRRKKIESNEISNAKTEFLSHISHEIRTPLNVIVGVSSLLKKKQDQFDEKTNVLIRTLTNSSNSLLELINSVLDISSIEARNFALTKERFSFSHLFEEINSIMGARATDKGISFMMDYTALDGMYYEGDKLRIRQILLNLINNAIKFTENGAVTLNAGYKASAKNCDKNDIEFQVIDSGIGIPEEKIDIIFNKYEQINNSDKYDGTGLGLPIVKELVDRMGGSIDVESVQGFGSKFFVCLPDNSVVKPTRVVEDKADEKSLKNYSILVAEDHTPNVLVLEYILENFGYNAKFVSNGKQVLEEIQKNNYDLILMDINMPEMNGVDATKEIRKLNDSKSMVPIIGMSAHVFDKEKKKCLEAGMNDYVTKPIDTPLLYETINKYISHPK